MHLSNERLLVILLVGLVAGWLASQVMRGSGFGLIGDLIVGLLGAFIGDWLLPRLDIHLGRDRRFDHQCVYRRDRIAPYSPPRWRGRVGVPALGEALVSAWI